MPLCVMSHRFRQKALFLIPIHRHVRLCHQCVLCMVCMYVCVCAGGCVRVQVGVCVCACVCMYLCTYAYIMRNLCKDDECFYHVNPVVLRPSYWIYWLKSSLIWDLRVDIAFTPSFFSERKDMSEHAHTLIWIVFVHIHMYGALWSILFSPGPIGYPSLLPPRAKNRKTQKVILVCFLCPGPN